MGAAVREALATAIGARVPVLVWGGPGIGKTSAVREMAAAAALPCEVVIASIREPSDFAGLPVVGRGGVTFAPPKWAERLNAAGRGVLFLDEITTAPPAVQAALLRVVLERAAGDLALPDGVAIVAAANPPDQAADGWDLAPPLANRFCHLDWVLDAPEWAEGMLAGFSVPEVPTFDAVELDRHALRIHAALGAFVRARPALLYASPDDEAGAGRAWPSPRTWAMAARLLAAAEMRGLDLGVAAMLVAGCVGPAAATELLAWRSDLELPDAEAVLADPGSFRLPERGDRAYAALCAVVAAVVADTTAARWEAAWRAVEVGVREGMADVAVAAVRTLARHRPDGARPPADVLRALAPVLRSAGLFERLTSS